MRIETNDRLVRRNRQIAQIMFFASLALLGVGLFFTNYPLFAPDADLEAISSLWAVPSVILPLAFLFTMFSVRLTNWWVRRPRPEDEFQENLKGLGNKAVLYNYYHFPARHVLIAPQGVYAIITRFQDGKISVTGDKWQARRGVISRLLSFFRLDGIGNPSADAQMAAEHIQQFITPIAPDIRVQPLVVFYDPRVRLEVVNPTVPVVHVQTKLKPSLKDYLRDVPHNARVSLTPEQIAAFEAATLSQGAQRTGIDKQKRKRVHRNEPGS